MTTLDILLGALFLLLCAILVDYARRSYNIGKHNLAAIMLVVLCFLLGVYMISTPHLQPWDERYHALVAKNMMDHPLLPTLYENPILSYDYKAWAGNHIWVHKQPVTLWGIALSMKMFGTNLFAVRFPSLIMTAAGVYIVYLIGKRLFNPRVGLIAGFFFSINGLILELVAGRMATDHVDVFFMFFVTLSVLCALYFAQTRKFWWNILCGLFIGLAILCKWLPALIVLPIWLTLVLHYKQTFKYFFLHGLLLLGVIVLVALPWQLYIYANFPLEAAWESKYNVLHLLQDLEHTGKPFYYYADVMRVSYGELIYIPLCWAGYQAWKLKKDGRYWALLVWILIPFLFFSFSATKLQGYTLFCAAALFLLAALFIDELLKGTIKLRYKWLKITLLILLFILPVRYTVERLKPFQGPHDVPQWQMEIEAFSQRIGDRKDVVIFNTQYPIEFMFHTNATAYIGTPLPNTLDSLRSVGYEVYVVKRGNYPEEWKN
ncbi:MAG: hypothetical protein Crog4KO_27920 [Crocinitomicaceae bacterium]